MIWDCRGVRPGPASETRGGHKAHQFSSWQFGTDPWWSGYTDEVSAIHGRLCSRGEYQLWKSVAHWFRSVSTSRHPDQRSNCPHLAETEKGKDSHKSLMPVHQPPPISVHPPQRFHTLTSRLSSARDEAPFQLGLQNRLRVPKDVLGIQDCLEPAQPLDQTSAKIQLVGLLSRIRRIDVVEIC